jgi:hypothetical protein
MDRERTGRISGGNLNADKGKNNRGADPVPASEANIVGKTKGDVTLLRKAKSASTIRLEKAL